MGFLIFVNQLLSTNTRIRKLSYGTGIELEDSTEMSTLALLPAGFCQQGGATRQVSETTPPAQPSSAVSCTVKSPSPGSSVASILHAALPHCLVSPLLALEFSDLDPGKASRRSCEESKPSCTSHPIPSRAHWPLHTPLAAGTCRGQTSEARQRVSFPMAPLPACPGHRWGGELASGRALEGGSGSVPRPESFLATAKGLRPWVWDTGPEVSFRTLSRGMHMWIQLEQCVFLTASWLKSQADKWKQTQLYVYEKGLMGAALPPSGFSLTPPGAMEALTTGLPCHSTPLTTSLLNLTGFLPLRYHALSCPTPQPMLCLCHHGQATYVFPPSASSPVRGGWSTSQGSGEESEITPEALSMAPGTQVTFAGQGHYYCYPTPLQTPPASGPISVTSTLTPSHGRGHLRWVLSVPPTAVSCWEPSGQQQGQRWRVLG